MAIHDSRTHDGGLRETADEARRIAGEARHEAELERPTAHGAGGHPHPDIREADQLRAEDDVRTYARQADLAETQASAAEALERNAALLRENREELADARERVRENRDEVRDVTRNTEALESQLADTHKQVRDSPTPDVE
ncbi:MAG TPA: hypothetical protein VFQ39_10120 [Longimicrobium sp.]|nr:hypothetical protein [Longimicrobium sp.]